MNKKTFLASLFILIGLFAVQIKVSNIAGTKAVFTLFDAYGPTAGAFLGAQWGIAAVFLIKLTEISRFGLASMDLGMLLRLIPILFAVLYFSRKSKLNWLIPVIAIAAFNLHPVGRTVWFYSLFWLIPLICYRYQNNSLVARSFGATFVAHAVGGVLWIYAFNLPKEVWVSLVPIVIIERLMFGFGIALSHMVTEKAADLIQHTFKHEIHQD